VTEGLEPLRSAGCLLLRLDFTAAERMPNSNSHFLGDRHLGRLLSLTAIALTPPSLPSLQHSEDSGPWLCGGPHTLTSTSLFSWLYCPSQDASAAEILS
jgi:hypothetical protein